MRVTLVRRQPDLDAFDRVFDAAFREADLGADPHARRSGPTAFPAIAAAGDPASRCPVRGDHAAGGEAVGLPWHTLPRDAPPRTRRASEPLVLPELLPSALSGDGGHAVRRVRRRASSRVLGRWLERAAPRWPVRRSRDGCGPDDAARPIALRADDRGVRGVRRGSRCELQASAPGRCARGPLTLVTDVSASMQSYSRRLPPPDAGLRPHRPRRDVRVLDLADPADAGAGAPFGRRGAGPGRGARRRPVRRDAPRPLPAGPAGLAARIDACAEACS